MAGWVAFRALLYSCRMCEIRESSSVTQGYTCGKCVKLQLLTDHIWEVELWLDNLRIIRENEGALRRDCSEVVMPKLQAESGFVTTRKGNGSRQKEQESIQLKALY